VIVVINSYCRTVQGVFFPAIHAMFGHWSPPMERSIIGSMSMAGWSLRN